MKRICLLVADASRARVLTYVRDQQPDGLHEELREECDLVDPARRSKPSELFSDDSGANHSGRRGYAFDDHRQAHLDQLDINFAKQIVAELERVTHERDYAELVVVASSRMIGDLRHSLEHLRRKLTITELQRDFTKLTLADLRDHLADLKLLPPRLSNAPSAGIL